jgi:FADH2 O2-dependent halogenase
MIEADGDVLILGSGFGGCLTALVLQQIGHRPVVVDRAVHPRFAIGESSTPASDMLLRDLCERYSLSRLAPLTHYGTWKSTYPQVTCGLKRGFSYFEQLPHRDFVPQADHANELFVSASSDNEHSDTHWFRADVDAFFADEVRRAGIPLLEETLLTGWQQTDRWKLTGECRGEPVELQGDFLLDATGDGRLLSRWFHIPDTAHLLNTNSRAVFSHFASLRRWEDLLMQRGGRVQDHPYPCDDSALHHIFDIGWMYQLPFDNGLTSAGFVIDGERHPLVESISPEQEWRACLDRYPAVSEQFAPTTLAAVPGGIRRSGRLQRRAERIVGPAWAMLPHTAGFIDPFYSTGIAHTMCGIEKLGRLFERQKHGSLSVADWQEYEQSLHSELSMIDTIVWNSFRSFRNFRLLTFATMFYFAASTMFEQRRHDQRQQHRGFFLLADEPDFRRVVDWFSGQLTHLLKALPDERTQDDPLIDQLEAELRDRLQPYNRVGLLDKSVQNMYRYTAATK